jgi:hypothetical protein
MFVIVRVDAPQMINIKATSSPKPVWEDANGNTMTLKKVWADASGKEIDEEEYWERKRKTIERQGTQSETTSSCCGSKTPKEEPLSPQSVGGCRHRQNVTNPNNLAPDPVQHITKIANDPWMSACSCGSGCSCLYCPDHPNNATSINHTQQQVKHFVEKAYNGDLSSNVPLMPEANSRSCMGGRPTFFLSRTPGVSQQQFMDPDAIYLTYPIQQHSWTNQPNTAHCSHVQSPRSNGGK